MNALVSMGVQRQPMTKMFKKCVAMTFLLMHVLVFFLGHALWLQGLGWALRFGPMGLRLQRLIPPVTPVAQLASPPSVRWLGVSLPASWPPRPPPFWL